MSDSFTQILIFTTVALFFGSFLLILSLVMQKIMGIGTYRPIKSQEYECGVKPLGKTLIRFDVKYYLFALLFIVFDVEFVFLMPWALFFSKYTDQFKGTDMVLLLLAEAVIFVLVLVAGWFYALKVGALEWAPMNEEKEEE